MPISEDTLTAVREVLADERQLDASRIRVESEGDRVVLRGSVPTHSQVDVAATLAEAHAPAVRTALQVDPGLREDAASEGDLAAEPAEAATDEEAVRPSRRSTSDPALSTQTSEFRPQPVTDDLVTDEDTALAENLPWDPPDAPHSAPTGEQQRGVAPRDADTESPDSENPDPWDGETASLSDLSAAELAKDARPDHDRPEEER